MTREELKNELLARSQDGRITCQEAWALAEEAEVDRLELGRLANELKIKIRACQLGCF